MRSVLPWKRAPRIVTRARRKARRSACFWAISAGANRGGARLAMTAPVEQTGAPSRIAMTAPVEIAGGQANGITMRFFLPGAMVRKGAPEPLDARVRIVEVPPATLAVLRFSGPLDARTEAQRARELMEQVQSSGWRVAGTPLILAYDPPFTIPFLRRNEIAVAVERP
jgi:hypothetical protein